MLLFGIVDPLLSSTCTITWNMNLMVSLLVKWLHSLRKQHWNVGNSRMQKGCPIIHRPILLLEILIGQFLLVDRWSSRVATSIVSHLVSTEEVPSLLVARTLRGGSLTARWPASCMPTLLPLPCVWRPCQCYNSIYTFTLNVIQFTFFHFKKRLLTDTSLSSSVRSLNPWILSCIIFFLPVSISCISRLTFLSLTSFNCSSHTISLTWTWHGNILEIVNQLLLTACGVSVIASILAPISWTISCAFCAFFASIFFWKKVLFYPSIRAYLLLQR